MEATILLGLRPPSSGIPGNAAVRTVLLCIHRDTTKTISLSDEAYDALVGLKKPGESFSNVALRLSQRARQESILDLAGSWEMDDEEADAMKRTIYGVRDASMEPAVDLG